jgi:hypothetical protein
LESLTRFFSAVFFTVLYFHPGVKKTAQSPFVNVDEPLQHSYGSFSDEPHECATLSAIIFVLPPRP